MWEKTDLETRILEYGDSFVVGFKRGGKFTFSGGFTHRTREAAERSIATEMKSLKGFWNMQLDTPGGIVIDGWHYRLGPEPSANERGLGHGGREFKLINLVTHELVVSHNLWCQGQVPDQFLPEFQNTHRFI